MGIKHAKTNTIPAWTQPDLDAAIAKGQFPPGTLLSDITLSTDWNSDHVIVGGLPASTITGGDPNTVAYFGPTGTLTDNTNFNYTANGYLKVATADNRSIALGPYPGSSGYGGIWTGSAAVSPTSTNYTLLGDASNAFLNCSAGSTLFFRSNNADLVVFNSNAANFSIPIQSNTVYQVPIIAKGFSGQISDLQQWQNSTGSPLATIGSDGRLTLTDSSIYLANSQTVYSRDVLNGQNVRLFFLDAANNYGCRNEASSGGAYYGVTGNSTGPIYFQIKAGYIACSVDPNFDWKYYTNNGADNFATLSGSNKSFFVTNVAPVGDQYMNGIEVNYGRRVAFYGVNGGNEGGIIADSQLNLKVASATYGAINFIFGSGGLQTSFDASFDSTIGLATYSNWRFGRPDSQKLLYDKIYMYQMFSATQTDISPIAIYPIATSTVPAFALYDASSVSGSAPIVNFSIDIAGRVKMRPSAPPSAPSAGGIWFVADGTSGTTAGALYYQGTTNRTLIAGP